MKGQRQHLGLRSYPLSFSIFPSLSFAWVFPSLIDSLIIPMVYCLLALKSLSLTLHTSLATGPFLFSPVTGKCDIFQKGENSQLYWMLLRGQGSKNRTHERAPVIYCVRFHIYSLWPPRSSFCPITPLKLLLSGYPGIPSSHILWILNLSAAFNTVESSLLEILILPKAEPEKKLVCRWSIWGKIPES